MTFGMDTAIGNGINRRQARWAALLAVGIVAVDMALVRFHVHAAPFRLCALIGGIAVYGKMVNWRMSALGLVLLPTQPLRYWLRVVAILGGLMGVWLVVACGVLWGIGHPVSIRALPLPMIPHTFYYVCISAPVFEEIIYRLVVCVAATALLGPVWAIVISGVVFAACHLVGGVGAPDNLVAGFVLGWAFLKSGSLTVPVALHALGNFCVVSAESVMGIWVSGHSGPV